jgi:hypothetical protein
MLQNFTVCSCTNIKQELRLCKGGVKMFSSAFTETRISVEPCIVRGKRKGQSFKEKPKHGLDVCCYMAVVIERSTEKIPRKVNL